MSKRRRIDSEDEDDDIPPLKQTSDDDDDTYPHPARKARRRASIAEETEDFKFKAEYEAKDVKYKAEDVNYKAEDVKNEAEDAKFEAEVEVDGSGHLDKMDVDEEDDMDLQRSARSNSAGPSRTSGRRITKTARALAYQSQRNAGKKAKRRAPEFTDDEAEDDHEERGAMSEDISDDGDHPKRKKGASGSKGKTKGGKVGATKSSGRKGTKDRDEREITFRDERKLSAPTPEPDSRRVSASPPIDMSVDPEESVDTAVRRDGPPAPPPKRKYLNFKKNKLTTNPPTPSTPSAKPPVSDKNGFNSPVDIALPPKVGLNTRKPAATIGSADFDLRDASVYASLFKVSLLTFVHS